MEAFSRRACLWMLHRAFAMDPRINFVTQALDASDKFESELSKQEQIEIANAKKRREENPVPPEEWVDPETEDFCLRQWHRVVLPLNARYTALVSAVAGMEWLIMLLHGGCHYEVNKFAQKQAKNADAEIAHVFKSMEVIIQTGRSSRGRVSEMLKILADKGGIWEKESSQSLWEDFRALHIIRNAIVHCGGRVADVRNCMEFRNAVSRLKFRTLTKVEVDGEEFSMPMAGAETWSSESEQLWIERGALREPVERVLDFIRDVHKAYFD